MVRRYDEDYHRAFAALGLVYGGCPRQLHIIHLRPLVRNLLVCTVQKQSAAVLSPVLVLITELEKHESATTGSVYKQQNASLTHTHWTATILLFQGSMLARCM